MAYGYLLAPSFQFVNINGRPLVGGHIEVFIHNTDTKYITKADFDGTDNPFKVPLNSKGMAVIIASGDFTYDVFCYDRFGSLFWSGSDVAIDNSSGLVIEGAELPMRIVGGKITNNGKELTCTGENAWAEGAETTASGANAHAEGGQTTASGEHSHSEGFRTTASSGYSHAEGAGTKATNTASHAEGQDTTASGQASHAEGRDSVASGDYSHASGRGTRATNEGSHAVGKFNDDGEALFVVGNGTASNKRKDVFKVDRNEDTWVMIGGVLTKVTNVSGGGGNQFVLVRSNMTTDFTNAEYQDCVDAVTAEKAVCVQFVMTGTTIQAQLTMITGGGTLVFEFTAENYHYRWKVDAANNAHVVELIGNIFGVPIFDTLQDAIASEYTLKSGDVFETNGFHTSGDGGASRYRVSSTGTANGMDIVQLAAGKLAVLQVENDELYPEQIGYIPTLVYADRVDCTPYFTRIWNLCKTIRLRKSRYWFNGYVTLPPSGRIIGENIYGDSVSEMSTYRSGDYFIYCENRENVIENVVVSNRHNNGYLSPVETGGVGIRSNEWLHDGAAHFDYAFRHLRLMGFRKGMELQGTTKWAVTLYDIRCSLCYIGIEFGEASFNIDCHKIYTDHCSFAGIRIHGEGVFGFYDCNIGSVNTGVKIAEYVGSQYHDILLTFVNTNFECDDQTLENVLGLYFDIDDALDAVINLYGCRFMQNAGVYTNTNRCIKLGANTLVNIKGCEVRNNTGSAQLNDNFWNELYPCKFVLGAIRISDNCRGVPTPSFTDSKYNLCCVETDTEFFEIVSSGGGGVPVHNLYDNSSPTILAGYVSEPNADHPTGFFTLNNSTQVTLAIPITQYMQGNTIRLSCGTTSHNRWKYAKSASLPSSGVTDVTYVGNSFTTDGGRDYCDFSIGASETGYILIFFGSGISTSDFINDVMVCVSPYFTPYEMYQGGATTYSPKLKTPLINLDELVSALNLRGNSLV